MLTIRQRMSRGKLGSLLLGLLACCAGYSKGFTANNLVYPGQNEFFELSIVHLNDFHARFVQTSFTSGTCHKGRNHECIGGLGRVVTASRQLMQERPNAIFLNAGDHYQGTLWYNVHKWNATVHFMNKLPHDAMTIGNHDFDDKIAGLVPFLERAKAPVVVTNIDIAGEPSLRGYFQNSTVITRGNRTIGVIGVIIKTTNTLSSTENLGFLDEVETVNAEAERLRARGVNIIIVLSHAGLDVDRIMAANCPEIDVIVGGHSHTFLYTGKPPFIDVPEDEYPVVVRQTAAAAAAAAAGSSRAPRTVLIVQAAAYTKYLGNLTVWFTPQGEVADWEGNPILLDSSIEEDPEIMEELMPWAEVVEATGQAVVGETRGFLNSSCRSGECNLANLITDAMVYSYQGKGGPKQWTYAAISCMNAGGIRNGIPPGVITYGDLVTVQPFENTWDVVEVRGEDLRLVLEESVSRSYEKDKFVGAGFLHWAGIRVVYNISKPAFSRIVDLSVRCQACEKPVYEPLDEEDWYRLVVPAFLLKGGDNVTALQERHRHREPGPLDVDEITEYIKAISPFKYENEQRMLLLGEWRG
ncbi:apyrase [Nasonia vitripennis]|uniref:Apyrase n=1 Tax=Nasonia vitripennis TaxID=7425 RepID=A0A7M7TDS4_NASVI|nr:apyrase [Nasonia vitripennis]